MKGSLYIALFVAFVDYMGVGLIYPLFSSMLFDPDLTLLPAHASPQVRSFWLGFLLSLMSLAQFFSAPVWGAISDSKGRKTPLQLSILIGVLGYLIGLGGIFYSSLFLLLSSRIVIGIAAGNMSVVQASIADLSTKENKAKHFGLYSMALGLGFTLGPFFGGGLSRFGYLVPFMFAFILMALNFLFTLAFFKETIQQKIAKKWKITSGIFLLKKALSFPGLRAIFITSFLHNFAWSFFFEFMPVYLISKFHFSVTNLGLFFGISGGYYALSAGVFIRPFVKRFKPETLYFVGLFFTGISILTMLLFSHSIGLWSLLFFVSFFVAFVYPTGTTIVSNGVSPEIQGEALGVLSSVGAVAFILSPLFSGSLVGAYPTLPMWVGGIVFLGASLIILAVFRTKLFYALKKNE